LIEKLKEFPLDVEIRVFDHEYQGAYPFEVNDIKLDSDMVVIY